MTEQKTNRDVINAMSDEELAKRKIKRYKMNKQKFVKYLWQLWERRNTDFDNLWTGAGHGLKAGYTCRFHKKDCHVEFTGTVMYSNSKCAYVVISNGGCNLYITYLKDVYPVGVPVHWTEYYGELLKEVCDAQNLYRM